MSTGVESEHGPATARPSATEYADAVAEQIHLIRRLYQAHLNRAYADTDREMVYMAGRILDHVARHPGCGQSDLSAYFHRDKGQVAKIVANLREKGLLEVEVVASDRRRQRLRLTEKGATVRDHSQRERDAVARQGVAGLDMSERMQLLELLTRMRQNLEFDASVEATPSAADVAALSG
jgi:DNA-binding MarR family transcriptional regulator